MDGPTPGPDSPAEDSTPGFKNVDVLPLGKLLQTKFLSGKRAKGLGRGRKKTLSKLRKKGFA